METAKVAEYARSLYEAHGDKAEAEAAQRARQSRKAGNSEEADTWEAIWRAVSEIRGAHES
jgi:ATP-dependent helicase/DNAse subunit B